MEEKQEKTVKKVKKAKTITNKANKKGRHINKFLNVMRCLIIPPFYLLKPFRFYGNRKVKDGACVYICNHYAMLDPVYAAATTWEAIHFIAKSSLFKAPVVGWAMRNAKAISVNRDGNDARSLLDCFKCLKNNEKVCIFPEGTRNKTEAELLPFHPGAAMMAIKCKAPIVPIVIYNKPKFFRLTHVLIGEPFELTEYYDRKLSEEELAQADECLRQRMLDMKKEHSEYLANKKKNKNKKA